MEEKFKIKRAVFVPTDVKLLLECAKNQAHIIENKKTNKITPEMKRKVSSRFYSIFLLLIWFFIKAWESILADYNSGQTGGIKTLKTLQDKYKNEKKLAKKRISEDRCEMLSTGGGSAKLQANDDSFMFTQEQIKGLQNQFDCDYQEKVEEEVYLQEDMEQDDEIQLVHEKSQETQATTSASSVPFPKYSNKKMKASAFKDEFSNVKLESLKLDNEYKKRLIQKTNLEIQLLENKLNYCNMNNE